MSNHTTYTIEVDLLPRGADEIRRWASCYALDSTDLTKKLIGASFKAAYPEEIVLLESLDDGLYKGIRSTGETFTFIKKQRVLSCEVDQGCNGSRFDTQLVHFFVLTDGDLALERSTQKFTDLKVISVKLLD